VALNPQALEKVKHHHPWIADMLESERLSKMVSDIDTLLGPAQRSHDGRVRPRIDPCGRVEIPNYLVDLTIGVHAGLQAFVHSHCYATPLVAFVGHMVLYPGPYGLVS
jgi:hypothetical protein